MKKDEGTSSEKFFLRNIFAIFSVLNANFFAESIMKIETWIFCIRRMFEHVGLHNIGFWFTGLRLYGINIRYKSYV